MNTQLKKTLSVVLAVVILYAVVGVIYSAFRNDKVSLSKSEAAGRRENRGRCDNCNVFDWMFQPFGAPVPNVDVGPEDYRLPDEY